MESTHMANVKLFVLYTRNYFDYHEKSDYDEKDLLAECVFKLTVSLNPLFCVWYSSFELLNVNCAWVPHQRCYIFTELLATLAPRESTYSLNSVYFVFICQQCMSSIWSKPSTNIRRNHWVCSWSLHIILWNNEIFDVIMLWSNLLVRVNCRFGLLFIKLW